MADLPLSELVGVAWLRSIPTDPLAGAVATTRPGLAADGTLSWRATGFVEVGGTGGGSWDSDIQRSEAVLQLDLWAAPLANAASQKPPWNRCGRMLSAIRRAAADRSAMRRLIEFPAEQSWSAVRVHAVELMGDAARRTGDDASYARYQVDMRIVWNEVIVP